MLAAQGPQESLDPKALKARKERRVGNHFLFGSNSETLKQRLGYGKRVFKSTNI